MSKNPFLMNCRRFDEQSIQKYFVLSRRLLNFHHESNVFFLWKIKLLLHWRCTLQKPIRYVYYCYRNYIRENFILRSFISFLLQELCELSEIISWNLIFLRIILIAELLKIFHKYIKYQKNYHHADKQAFWEILD